jgi:hypothetical protein
MASKKDVTIKKGKPFRLAPQNDQNRAVKSDYQTKAALLLSLLYD